jgi:hypothetical protein
MKNYLTKMMNNINGGSFILFKMGPIEVERKVVIFDVFEQPLSDRF